LPFSAYEKGEGVFGLKTDVQAAILNHACDLMKAGEVLQTGKLYRGFLEGYSIQFIEADKDYYQNYVGYGGWYYGSWEFPLWQVVWPDKQQLFPCEHGFNPAWKFKQPLLDRNTDFKFYEERNLAVFTTKQAFEGEPILYVYHNMDGEWQFLTELGADTANTMVVALSQITKLDHTINEIYHLPYGWRAWRVDSHSDWQTEEYEIEEGKEE